MKNNSKKLLFSVLTGVVFFMLIFIAGTKRVYAEEAKWDFLDYYRSSSTYSIVNDVVYGSNKYSIKIVNTEYNTCGVVKKFDVKPNTHYKASVMARYENYKLESGRSGDSGAAIGVYEDNYTFSNTNSGSGWKKLEFEFDSGDSDSYYLKLFNGLPWKDCKGTAYFSGFCLEECAEDEPNEWDLMVVFLKNIDATVEMSGKKVHVKAGFDSDQEIEKYKKNINQLYCSVPMLSDGMWGIRSIDFYEVDTTITELSLWNENSVKIDPQSESVSKELDKIIEQAKSSCGKRYRQIIVVVPFDGDVAPSWLGLGGTKYNGAYFLQVRGSKTETGSFIESAYVHEMLHGINTISQSLNPDRTVLLHENVGVYSEYYMSKNQNNVPVDGDWWSWYSDYTRCQTPDKKGVVPESFYAFENVKYDVIYGKKTKDSYKKTDIATLNISNIKTKTYTGKQIKPSITVKNGKTTLKEGTDYTISYSCNVNVGTAAVIICGKGKYFGTAARLFDIVPAAVSKLTVKRDDKKQYVLTWAKNSNVSRYEICTSEDGGKTFMLTAVVPASETKTTINWWWKNDVIFKVRAVYDFYPLKYYGAFSNTVKL